jgi:SET domain-containing protein
MPPKKPWFELRRSKIQGTGAFALRDIPAGRRLIEYTGERITEAEAARRYDDEETKRHHTFLFDLDDGFCIDAKHEGSDARFINHSCAPNCEAIQEESRIFIHSLTAIAKGDELLYDYNYVMDGPLDAATRKLYACKCGAPECRGTIAVAREKKPAKKKPVRGKKR